VISALAERYAKAILAAAAANRCFRPGIGAPQVEGGEAPADFCGPPSLCRPEAHSMLGGEDLATGELSAVAEAVRGDEAGRFFFSGSGAGRSQRHAAVDEMAEACRLSPVSVSALHLLVDAGRMELLGEIAEGLRELADRAAGRLTASVTVARPMKAAERKRIAAAIQALVGRKVVVEEEVDPSVIGGVRARAGNLLIEGTVAGRLERLRHSLR